LKTFQSAFTLRKSLVIGRRAFEATSLTTKSAMPCSVGALPVAIVVQISGENMGS